MKKLSSYASGLVSKTMDGSSGKGGATAVHMNLDAEAETRSTISSSELLPVSFLSIFFTKNLIFQASSLNFPLLGLLPSTDHQPRWVDGHRRGQAHLSNSAYNYPDSLSAGPRDGVPSEQESGPSLWVRTSGVRVFERWRSLLWAAHLGFGRLGRLWWATDEFRWTEDSHQHSNERSSRGEYKYFCLKEFAKKYQLFCLFFQKDLMNAAPNGKGHVNCVIERKTANQIIASEPKKVSPCFAFLYNF